MRISDWSSDVCSSDLDIGNEDRRTHEAPPDEIEVEEQRDRQGDDELGSDDDDVPADGSPEAVEKYAVLEQVEEVLQADELGPVERDERCVGQGEPDGVTGRIEGHPQEKQADRQDQAVREQSVQPLAKAAPARSEEHTSELQS